MFDYNWYIGKQLKVIDRFAPNHLEDCVVLNCDEYCRQLKQKESRSSCGL